MATVTDPSAAVIPETSVVLKEEGSGALRRTVTNAEGLFTIVAVPAGTYTVTVEKPGFNSREERGVIIHAGDVIKLPDIVLAVAGVAQQVKVEATPVGVIPVDSGEKSEVITPHEIQDLSIIGRNAVELLKILPVWSTAEDRPEGLSS